jgi:HK97 family phage prohead protease
MPDFFAPWTVQLAGADAPAMAFSGVAALYGQPDDGRPYAFARGAFDRPVAEAQAGRFPAMLLQHGGWDMGAEDMLPIGLWTKLEATDAGLRVEGRLAETARGRDVHALMRMQPRPAIDGLSIGFRTTRRQENPDARGSEPRWIIQEIELVEISIVTFPAMAAARVSSVQAGAGRERDLERRLVRDAGLTRREARALMRSGLTGLDALRDAGEDGEQGAAGEDPSLAPAALAQLAELVSRNIRAMKG